MIETYRVADYIADFIEKIGVKNVFLLPGGGAMHLVDAVEKNSYIEVVACLHEQAAAISALFILVNSISALIGLITSGNYSPHEDIVTWILFAIVGGFAGSYIGSNKMSNKGVKYLLALILLLASIKLLSAFFVYMIN